MLLNVHTTLKPRKEEQRGTMIVTWRDSTESATYDAICCQGIFNKARPVQHPTAVVKATSTRDIQDAVALAKEHRCQITVRAGGHSIQVWGLRDDSILVDLGDWKEINFQQETGIVQVTPAVTGDELNYHLTRGFGRMFPGGHCKGVGLGGFLLSGGIGWNSRNYGWACEYIRALEVVTADGELLLCNAEQNQDLYWASRGAGPAFPGIVARVHLEVLPFHKEGFRSSAYVYPSHLHRIAVEWLLSITPGIGEDTETIMVAYHDNSQLCYAVKFVTFGSTATATEQLHQHIQKTRPPGTLAEWNHQEEFFESLYEGQAQANPQSHYYSTDTVFLKNDADVVTLLEHAFQLPPGKSYAFWNLMYPRSRRILSGMALGIQSDHQVCIYAISETKDEAEHHSNWLQKTMGIIRPHSVGAYLGESGPDILPSSWSWGENNTQRLTQVLQKWDPEGIFAAVFRLPRKYKP